jgi:hypothetical protein
MSSAERPPERRSTWRKLGDRAQSVWRTARGRDPKPRFSITHLGGAKGKPRLDELPKFSHDWGPELKKLGIVPEPPPEPKSKFVENIDDSLPAPWIDPDDLSPPMIEDPAFSDFSFSQDVFAELRKREELREHFGPYHEHLEHLEPGPTLQERLDHHLERGIEEPKLEPPVTLQQQLDALNDRRGVVVRSVEVAGWRLQQLHDELNDHTGRHQGDFGVGPNIPAQPPAADIHRSDDNRRARFAETKKVRVYDQYPSRESLTQDDYPSPDSNSPDDDDQSFDSNSSNGTIYAHDNSSTDTIYAHDNSSTDTIYPYGDPRATIEDDNSIDSNSSDGNSANAPGGIQIQVSRSTVSYHEPRPGSIYGRGSNPSSFGGYAYDHRVVERRQGLEIDRREVEGRTRDTTHDYDQSL